jgi:hypothetical protein
MPPSAALFTILARELQQNPHMSEEVTDGEREKKRKNMKYPKEYIPKLTMYKLSIPWTSTEHCARI